MRRALVICAVMIGGTACGGDDPPGGGTDSGTVRVDGGGADGGRSDAGGGSDAGAMPDAARADAGTGVDASAPSDGGPTPGDGGPAPTDAGIDAGGPPVDGGACIDPPPTPDRPAGTTCSPCRPVGPEPGVGGMCSMHSDCVAGDNGRCSFGMIGAFCSYDECFEDSDCAKGEVCSCDGAYFSGANTCVLGNCRINAECPTSGRCSPSYGCLMGSGPEGWYCRTATDTCATDADCTGMGLGGRCAYDTTAGHWACEFGICVT